MYIISMQKYKNKFILQTIFTKKNKNSTKYLYYSFSFYIFASKMK